MKSYKRLVNIYMALGIAAVLTVASVSCSLFSNSAKNSEAAWRFDCGPAGSELKDGYIALTAAETYDASRGYGWIGGSLESVELGLPGPGKKGGRGGGGSWMADFAMEHRTALTRDAVVSQEDLQFRVDVPDGVYRVTLTLGDFSQAGGSMDIEINGEVAEKRVAAWSPGVYRMLQKTPMGWWT